MCVIGLLASDDVRELYGSFELDPADEDDPDADVGISGLPI